MSTMYVPVFKGSGVIAFEHYPIPTTQSPDDVLVKVLACGICGTDLNILAVPPAHQATPGIIIGHEAVGIVETTGPAVNDLAAGDRVVVAPRLTCGHCAYCVRGLDNQCLDYESIGTSRNGAFAPYLLAPRRALFKIDPQVSVEDAVFFEPLSCVVGALRRVPMRPADNVAIIGAGPMGLLFAEVLRSMGAGKIVVIDLADFRLEFARRLGVDVAFNPSREDAAESVRSIMGLGADLVIDAVGNQINTAIDLSRRGGHILLFGLRAHDIPPVHQYRITRYDLTLYGTFVGLKPFTQTIQLLESGRIEPSRLITHRLPLSRLEDGLQLMRSGKAMKVLMEMN